MIKACEACHLKIRKHTDEIFSWPHRIPTVIDLTDEEQKVLTSGGPSALDECLHLKKHFAFPALDITEARIINKKINIVKKDSANLAIVYPANAQFLQTFSKKLASLFNTLTDLEVHSFPDDTFDLSHSPADNLLVLGGAHNNRILDAMSYQNLNYSDLKFPGEGGIMLNTVHGFPKAGKNIIAITCDSEGQDEVLKIIAHAVTREEDGTFTLTGINKSRPGKKLAAQLGTSENILSDMIQRPPLLQRGVTLTPDLSLFGTQINALFDSGGPDKNLDNGHSTIPYMIRIFHAYKISGDTKLLKIYKQTMLGLMDYYLNIPNGASILSDYDFYLGNLICTWWLAESEAIFSNAERLVITNFLLASTRQIYMYKAAFWPSEDNKLRHNHETFPALSLFRAAKYFDTFYDIPDTKKWFKEAEKVFSGPVGHVCKHKENSNSYLWMVPAHKLIYDVASGKMETIHNKIALKTAQTAVVSVDNFGYATDYGDTGCPIRCGMSMIPFLDMVAGAFNDGTLAWVTKHMRKMIPNSSMDIFPHPGWGVCGQHKQIEGGQPKCGELEFLKLEKHILETHDPKMLGLNILDKIGYRSGWEKESQYLFFEPSAIGSHTHHDMNGIIRYNHHGRLWIVDNGYGKVSGVKNCAQAWSSRQVGPEDHNVVIFKDKAGNPTIPPPFGVSTKIDDSEHFAAFQNKISNINGSDWLRTIVIHKDSYLLVIDQITVGGSPAEIECQFNVLGELTQPDQPWVLSQDGVKLFVQSAGAGETSHSSYINADWEAALTPNVYPYAQLPVKKLLRKIKTPENGKTITCVTLFEASAEGQPKYKLEYEEHRINIQGPHPKNYRVTGENKKQALQTTSNTLEIILS